MSIVSRTVAVLVIVLLAACTESGAGDAHYVGRCVTTPQCR